MAFIEDRDGPRRLLCMTGAAGSGKSALQQTTAETCGKKKFLACSFFFSASDLNRNTVDPVIPTIAYQLGRGNPVVKQLIKAAVEGDSLIFSQSLEDQITTLIVEPIEHLSSMGLDLSTLPCAVLIDALDECRGEDCQAELLTAIRKCLLVDSLPFRIFIASRPEWAIRSALEPGGELNELAYHIQLSDQYDATADIRRYLQRRLRELGLRSRDPRARSPGWFSKEDIEKLVEAASGQFIYAATVVRYLSVPRSSAVDRLKIVLNWTPKDGQSARPFEQLDLLYHGILSAAKIAYEAVDTHHERDFLLLFRAFHINATSVFADHGEKFSFVLGVEQLHSLLDLENQAEDILITDLRSLVTIRTHLDRSPGDNLILHIYHKSFSDFLVEESRSRDLFVSQSRVQMQLAKCFLQRVVRGPEWGA
ncbi:hypothetical protein EST38_g12953 [Candolleomyces aberdarensis]|uniref:Nephrocystin 3-like N-terminal domain-containing protein n=1 Tax=Candolleomyces aberdarensis TaxID=2316362 RepID=A0A4Q2D3H0_9AGAR|nr:hypothetical protein EST38_g12953 [Candolleomyces aberdarensis]